ncbi:hypothetical protein [Asticcacaulis sp. YBE204]|uniref:hypothetical protein n=1 Tax=Asticcacaulis sp. YBE204 TaxID=1282363 RepID=UPI0003C3FA80|nr:hypothetical protein [Asticcacaulis sp. YBE204]ESQ78522.1 hypothetical protein AEYBE204_13305 [Asticcacaulis sp. YBE204]
MHRIDTFGSVLGKFVRSIVGVRPATLMGADWPNAVQEEICTVIEDSGLVLDKEADDQLRQAIERLIADSPHTTQLGEKRYFHRKVAETEYYVFPRGQALLLTDYPDLVAAMEDDPFVTSDPAVKLANAGMWLLTETELIMPDLQGDFERIWAETDLGDGVDRPALGHHKDNQFKLHSHKIKTTGTDTTNDQISDGTGPSIDRGSRTESEGGDETNPDHTAHWVLIRIK